jgi:hypothetical protein
MGEHVSPRGAGDGVHVARIASSADNHRRRSHMPTTRNRRALYLTLLACCASPMASAQEHDHAGHASHSDAAPTAAELRSGGDAVFEAIAEVVTVLERDAQTNWSAVDIDALRAHLLDMNALFQRAVVASEEIPRGARFRVTGAPDALQAARRMVPAHARMLDGERGWSVNAALGADAVVLEVAGADDASAQRIRGLGFFGLMASGEHHRVHHLAIAQGRGQQAHDAHP